MVGFGCADIRSFGDLDLNLGGYWPDSVQLQSMYAMGVSFLDNDIVYLLVIHSWKKTCLVLATTYFK